MINVAEIRAGLNDPEGKFNNTELDSIANRIHTMLQNNEMRTYFKVGKHDVCLERDSTDTTKVSAHLMNNTLDNNNDLVNKYNKRK